MKENKILYKTLKIIIKPLLKMLYRPKAKGTENIPKEGPIIFVGNHIHAFDSVVVMTHTDRMVHYMAKESLFKGLHGKILEAIGIIKVYRSKSNPMAVIEATKVLEQGGTVGIFPEGTRNKTEQELLKFRHGAVAIAQKANSPIIPFAIKGKYRLFGKGLTIEFGEPINVTQIETEEANNVVRNEVLNLLRR